MPTMLSLLQNLKEYSEGLRRRPDGLRNAVREWRIERFAVTGRSGREENRRTGVVRAGFMAPVRGEYGMRGRSMGPGRVQSVRRMS